MDVDSAVISRALARGILHPGGSCLEWIRQFVSHYTELAAGRSGDDDLNLAVERARLAKAQTERIQLEIKKVRGEFRSVSALSVGLNFINGTIRSKLLALPSRVRSRVQLPGAAVTAMDDVIRECLTELGQTPIPRAISERMENLDENEFNQKTVPEEKRVDKEVSQGNGKQTR